MNRQSILEIIEEEILYLQYTKKIIQETDDNKALEFFEDLFYRNRHPIFRRIIEREVIKEVKVDCPFANRTKSDVIEFLTSPGQRQEGVKEIKNFLHKSEHLSIIDPYFFNPPNKTKANSEYIEKKIDINDKYIKEIQKTFIKESIKKLDIYCLPSPNKVVRQALQSICKEKNIQLNIYTSVSIHDRVIISDNNKAIVVGTSFGGLGNKYAFILPLPNEDLEEFKKELFALKN